MKSTIGRLDAKKYVFARTVGQILDEVRERFVPDLSRPDRQIRHPFAEYRLDWKGVMRSKDAIYELEKDDLMSGIAAAMHGGGFEAQPKFASCAYAMAGLAMAEIC